MAYVVISYIPALHKGYLDFFKKDPGELYILNKKFVLEPPRLERDIRAMEPEEIKQAVESLSIFSKVSVLSEADLEKIKETDQEIVLPDEDVNRAFAEKYLKDAKISFVSVFLRWDKQISTAELIVPPDRIISQTELDQKFMREAQEEADKSPDWWRQIGALVAKDGKVIISRHNTVLPSEYSLNAFGDPRSNFDAGQNIELVKTIHAEANAIAEAAKQGIALAGCSMYVTTFPCPVCAKSLAVAGINKLYYKKGYSLLDAEDVLKAFGVEIILVKD